MNGGYSPAQELRQYEVLARGLYAPESSQMDRQQANQALLEFTESEAYIGKCQLILDQSKDPYALLLASTSLKKLVTSYWNKFTNEQAVATRDGFLNYLASGCQDLPAFVTSALIQVLVRITKLGWDKDPQIQVICDQVGKFLQHTPQHCAVGLQILSELVNEMNSSTISAMTYLTHRRVAISFRERCLLQVFRLTLELMQKLKNDLAAATEETNKLVSETLKVCIQCLQFDYIGTNNDDAAEDGGTIQIPSMWRTVIEDPATLTALFDVFTLTADPIAAASSMEVLVLLSATRHSLFAVKEERIKFFTRLCMGTLQMIKQRPDALSNADCYHQFCRLLCRLKSNLQLEELCKMEGYDEWITFVAELTIQSLKSWEFSQHSIHYLLNVWGKITGDLPYMKGELPVFLDQFIPQIMEVFIDQRLRSIPKAMADSDLDEIFTLHEESLKNLTSVFKFKYEQMSESLTKVFDRLCQRYGECMQTISAQGLSRNLIMEMSVIENQIAVAVYIVGVLSAPDHRLYTNTQADMDRLDADMCALGFRVMQLLDMRTQKNFAIPGSPHLELSITYFLGNFRKKYMGRTKTFSRLAQLVPPKERVDYIFERLSHLLGTQMNEDSVLHALLNKILMNLKVWSNDHRVIEDALELLDGCATRDIHALVKIDACQALLKNHSVAHFQFLKKPENHRYVTEFYTILTRIAFKLDSGDTFDEFMLPFEAIFEQINATSLRSDQVKQMSIQVCRQLCGVLKAAVTPFRHCYLWVFNWIYPKYLNVLLRLLETWWDDPDVTIPILRLYSELVFSRDRRITFERNSPNGILLFQQTSKILDIYARRILALKHHQTKDVHKEKLKGVMLSLQIMHRSMSGDYVPFGVFPLYNEQALKKSLSSVLKLVLSEDLDQYMSYSKVAVEMFTFLKVLFESHLEALIEGEGKVFVTLTAALHEGLHSFDAAQCSSCATALDHLFEFILDCSKSKRVQAKNSLRRLNEALSKAGNLLHEIFASLFNRILFDGIEHELARIMTKTLLSLHVVSRESFHVYQQKLIACQPPEAKPIIQESFQKLMNGVKQTLEVENVEKFRMNMSLFTKAIGKFCISPR